MISRRPTMTDVAREAGVSQATVSLVLNNVPKSGITEATTQRVRESAERLGYRHNAMARGLKLQRSDTIGFVSANITTTPFAYGLVEGAQEGARALRKHLLIANVDYDEGDDVAAEERAIEELIERRVDGVVFASMFHRVIDVPTALREVPSVLLDARSIDGSLPSVVPDDLGGAKAITEHLMAFGHRSIVHISRALGPEAVDLRRQGFLAAHDEYGIRASEGAIVEGVADTISAYGLAFEILGGSDRPTAVFCFNDRMAWGVYQAAADLGLRIPTDLSVVGFDDVPLVASVLRPGLTTVRLPHVEMGELAVEKLVNGEIDPVHEVLPCPVVERGSVAPPNQSAQPAETRTIHA